MQHPFKTLAGDAIEKQVRKVSIFYSQMSLKERSGRVRGYMPITQLERVFLITDHQLRVECKDHVHSEGSNQGMVLGFVDAPKWSDSRTKLRKDAKTTKAIFGKTGIIGVGGPLPAGEDIGPPEKQADDNEPAFPHAEPYELDEELGHSYTCAAHIDLTVGPGHRALYYCIKNNPYLGFCITDAH